MWKTIVDTSRSVTRLVRRHRRAIVVGGLVGATVCLYYRTKRALREAAEAHEEIVRRAGLEARWRACLGRTRTECGEAILNFLPTLRKRLLLVVDVTGPVRELKSLRGMRGGNGSGGSRATADGSAGASAADMERREVELWEEVKVSALTRLVVGLYAFNLLSLMLRMQLHILGRIASEEAEELLSRASSGKETSWSSPSAAPGALANQEGSGDGTTTSKALGTSPESTLDSTRRASSGKPFSGAVVSETTMAAETGGVGGGAGQKGCEQGAQGAGAVLSMAARRELLTATYEYMLGDGLKELAADVERAVARYTSSWQAHTRQGVTYKDLVGVLRAVRMEVEAPGTLAGVGVVRDASGLGGGHADGDLDRGSGGEAIGRRPAASRAPNVGALVRYIINKAYGERQLSTKVEDGEASAGAAGGSDADDYGVEASRESQGGDMISGAAGSALADVRAADDDVTTVAAKAKKTCEDGVQDVLDETWDAAESPNFAFALQSSLDATFGMMYEQMRQKAFCRVGGRRGEATPGVPARAVGMGSVGEGGEGPGGGRAASSPDEQASPGVESRGRGSIVQDAASSASNAPGVGEGEVATQVLATVISQAKLVVSEVLEASTTNRYSQTLASLPTVEDLCFSVFFLDEQLPESSEPIPLFERQQVDDLSETLASPMFEPRGMYSATGLEGSLAAR